MVRCGRDLLHHDYLGYCVSAGNYNLEQDPHGRDRQQIGSASATLP
jgi:hypothetical protein